ncbi:MAG: hypothetical protein C5B53_10605 [Candidatus Melainabacteria bacterium]|nr:MAG: hypothetical protein C5B53_10605 [Candidatus Melainabacteria bacterium]
MPAQFCSKCRAQVGEFFKTCPYDGAELKPMPAPPSIGQIFADRYEIISILGEGGMSIVFKARHRFMDRIVALKLLRSNMISDVMSLERFKNEAQAVSLLSHPNIVNVYDFGIVDDIQPFLVMDYLDGTTLHEALEAEGGHISEKRGVRIFRQVCEGLQHAHEKGIVHRDLKPSNICLIKDEKNREIAKIVDFGVAKMMHQNEEGRMQLTQTGQVVGSPLFMSPEQCTAKPLDARSDIYSLGCVMYYSLTGELPITGITEFDAMSKHIHETPRSFKLVAPQLSIDENLEAAVFRCLEKLPEDRYQSAAELLADLPEVAPDTGSLAVKAVEHPLRTRLQFRIFRLGFFLLLGIVSVVLLYELIDQGPDNDKGTVFQKTIWNSETTLSQTLIRAKMYNLAQIVSSNAEKQAREWFNNRGRLLTARQLQRQLYKQSRNFDEFEAVNKKITELREEIIKSEYHAELSEIDELTNGKSEASTAVNKVLAELIAPRIIHAAKGLSGYGFDQEEETLLSRAKAVYTSLLGPRHPLIADFDKYLADCYLRQQQTYNVRQLLVEARSIFADAKGNNDRSTIAATLQLGQFDRDENRFELAKPELETALAKAKKYYPTDTYLNVQCLNSYADYYAQTGDKQKAEQLFDEAKALEKQQKLD